MNLLSWPEPESILIDTGWNDDVGKITAAGNLATDKDSLSLFSLNILHYNFRLAYSTLAARVNTSGFGCALPDDPHLNHTSPNRHGISHRRKAFMRALGADRSASRKTD